MKRTELKKVLKPLVKQCIKEVLLEEGVLSSVVSEVVVGLSPMLIENKNYSTQPRGSKAKQKEIALLEQQRVALEEEKMLAIKEQKRKILDATGFGSEIFEGVEPISSGGSPGSAQPNAGALAGVDPSDPGVDISGIMALGGHKWNKLV